MTVSLADLPKGHEFPETRFEMTSKWVSDYLAAVEDDAIGSLSQGAYPPLAFAALSIRALLDRASLAEGSIHVAQELSLSLGRPPTGALVARARIASRGERQGWVLMGVELLVEDELRIPMMTGRATITFPAKGAK
jgi:hypothetical protein